MEWSRVLGAVVVAVALALSAARAHEHVQSFPAAIPCSAPAISAAYQQVDSVQSFGCVGTFAYLWATVGHGVGEIGVTEVARFDIADARWVNAPRAHYCVDHRLPAYVTYWGCNSN